MSIFIELPNYVDKSITEEIRESVRPFVSKNKHHQYYRDGYTVDISSTPELKELDVKINGIFTKFQDDVLSRRYKPKFPSGSSNFEYHLYEPDDICNIHEDGEVAFGMGQNVAFIRYASVILHLNTVEDGGELVFPNQNVAIKTEEGKIVAFPPQCMFPHYTTPAKINREVVVTWFVYSNMRVVPA